MTSQNHNVIIFGATGAVGRAAALEAHVRGAHVWLAMRDTGKSIQGLDDADSDRYTRIQADISKPETLKDAVQKSGATAAFVYTMFASSDSMRGSFDALKEGGVKFVVLLSSWSVEGPAHNPQNQENFINAVHSKAEIAVEESGLLHATLRPAYFDSNIFMFLGAQNLKNGEVNVLYPSVRFDYIAPSDIGTVAGALLAKPPAETTTIDLCGPQLLTQREAVSIVAEVLGHDIKVNDVSEEQWKDKLKDHVPIGALDSLAKDLRKSSEGRDSYATERYKIAAANIKKYTGKESTIFEDWVEAHKAAFA